ncbi:MAG: ROK family protein [Christensenellaceae bacterium]|jgi:glucokinase
MLIAGIDIGGTKVALGLFDENSTLLAQQEFPVKKEITGDAFYAELTAALDALLSSIGATTFTHGGVGFPGIVQTEHMRVQFAPNAPFLNDYPLCEQLSTQYQANIVLENDANAAALAEYHLGAGQGYPDMVYSTVSTGIGGGILCNGKILRGSYFAAGEIGHTIIVPGGLLCGCGNHGCVEAYAGGANFPKQIEARIAAGEETLMKTLAAEYGGINGRTLSAAFAAEDEMAIDFLTQISWALGTLYYNIYKIINNNCFVLGGGLTNIGAPLFAGIEETFLSLKKGDSADMQVVFKQAHFSSSTVGIYGAALAALQ